MNILVSTPTFLPIVGGAELGIHEIYNRLGQRHKVTVVTPRSSARALAGYGADDYGDAAYSVEYIGERLARIRPSVAGKALRHTSLPYIAAVRRLAAQAAFDVANFHFLAPHGAAALHARHVLGIPVAVSLVGRPDVVRHLTWPKRTWANVTLRSADMVLPISDYYYPHSAARHPKVHTIPYGVDTQEYSPALRSASLRGKLGLAPQTFVLLAVQRLSPIKRVDMVIRVTAAIRERHPNAALVIIGQGEERDRLERLTHELGLDGHVTFAGYVSSAELPQYFASCDAFVFHSMFETFGIVFAQAMASGLPIIAANTSCVPYVVGPGNGTLVAPGDLRSFSDAASRFIADPGLRRQVGAVNRDRACREFDWDLIASQYEDALNDVARS